jgi:hypothetical protein
MVPLALDWSLRSISRARPWSLPRSERGASGLFPIGDFGQGQALASMGTSAWRASSAVSAHGYLDVRYPRQAPDRPHGYWTVDQWGTGARPPRTCSSLPSLTPRAASCRRHHRESGRVHFAADGDADLASRTGRVCEVDRRSSECTGDRTVLRERQRLRRVRAAVAASDARSVPAMRSFIVGPARLRGGRVQEIRRNYPRQPSGFHRGAHGRFPCNPHGQWTADQARNL